MKVEVNVIRLPNGEIAAELKITGDLVDNKWRFQVDAAIRKAADMNNPNFVLNLRDADIINAAGLWMLDSIWAPNQPWAARSVRVVAPRRGRRWIITLLRFYPDTRFFDSADSASGDAA